MVCCSICIDSCYGRAFRTPCGHMFHFGCLRRSLQHDRRCPLCRQEISAHWMRRRRLLISSRVYWSQVEHSFGPIPHYGPLIPSHQRRVDYDAGLIQQVPAWWTRPWIQDRLVELRMRFNVPADIDLTSQDLRTCENNGTIGTKPEWAFPTWVRYEE